MYLGSLAGSLINEEASAIGLGLGMIYGVFEGLVRFAEYDKTKDSHGSLLGYLPSKAINYFSEKHNNAKKNIERDVEGGNKNVR